MENFFRKNNFSNMNQNFNSTFQNNKDLKNVSNAMEMRENLKQEQIRHNQTINNFTAKLKDLSTDPTQKAYVLGSLSRISDQISVSDYNEIVNNVKGSNKITKKETNKPEKTELKPQPEQETLIQELKRFEREINRNNY